MTHIFHRLPHIPASVLILLLIMCPATPARGQENAAEPRDRSLAVHFASLRGKTDIATAEEYFDGSRGELRVGTFQAMFSPIPGLEELAESAPFYIPDEKIDLTGLEETQPEDFFEDLGRYAARNDGNMVIYVHGYNVDFGKSCRRSAIFKRSLDPGDRVILFSWPSDGNVLKYTWDEADLVWSVPHLAQFLAESIAHAGRERISLVAHSLGARGTIQALVRMAARETGPPLFNELILIAPDMDTDVFRQELPLVRKLAKRITIYASDNDKALKLSHEVHGYPRLGEAGDYLAVLPGVETIDISSITIRRFSGHLYHLFNPDVISDLTLLLKEGKPAAQRPALKESMNNGQAYWRMTPGDG